MEYTRKFNEFKSIFNPEAGKIKIDGSAIEIVNINFISETAREGFFNRNDISINENTTFSYPVFVPAERGSSRVIILLHGLNERSWVKYLVWAYYLAEQTGSYVILFPISFHINRSPSSWRDPRALFQTMNQRKVSGGGISMLSFANIALSNRLTEDPRRFFNSGVQTVNDIVKLMKQIKLGSHDIIRGGSRVNIFAYSIGAFLAQIIMMGNRDGLFSGSKLFMFCGGSVFSNMQGTSRLIMDSLAYRRVYSYYLDEFEGGIKGKSELTEYLQSDRTVLAFRSMIDLGRHRRLREKAIGRLGDQIRSVALANDSVIPPKGIVETMKLSKGLSGPPVEVWDFAYPYTHENPFPVVESKSCQHVDSSFERLFSGACQFLG